MTRQPYEWLEGFSAFLVAWVALFTVVTLIRIVHKSRRGDERVGHSAVLVELAAIPLAILQSACFVKSVLAGDVFSMALFLWWGPGFVGTALYLLACKLRGVKPDFYPMRKVISWLCKTNYVAFTLVFLYLGLPSLVYVYSVWIINDQIGMAFLSLDADRLRRTFHDKWLVRVMYPAGLFIPFVFPDMAHAALYEAYGVLLFALWAAGIWTLSRRSDMLEVPKDTGLLRNLVYFSKPG